MNLSLAGDVVVVTGATGGIGQAVVRMLLGEGATVVALHRGSPQGVRLLEDLASESGPGSGRIVLWEVDLLDAESCSAAISGIAGDLGGVHALVNNAGATFEKPFLASREEDVRGLAEVNLWAAMRLTRLVLKPMMLARRGSVINITSAVASKGGRGVVGYAATKAALEGMTRSLALEMAPRGIRINAVAPGLIQTRMSKALSRRRVVSPVDRIPLGRMGSPEDVAHAVAWLASERASGYVTGHTLRVDGGYRI